MTLSKVEKIVKQLNKKTESGEVEWETTANTSIFQAAFSEYTITIEQDPPADTILTIVNSEGVTIERVGEVDVDFVLLRELYERARRTALDVDEALDDLLDELGG